MDTTLPAVVMRGGTSKAVFLHGHSLPPEPAQRDAVILSVFGSPDRRQIDGLGGAEPLTSKLAIVSRSTRFDADVDYTFGQVGIEQASVNYALTCGNIASAVGPFAIDEGIVPSQAPVTRVRIHNTNTGKIILADVPVENGRARTEGDCAIDGVPGTGAGIRLTFVDPGGSVTGRLLPSGSLQDELPLRVPGAQASLARVSLVDSGTLYAFLPAAALGLRGDETADALEGTPGLMEAVDDLRRRAAAYLMHCGALNGSLAARLASTFKVALIGRATDGQADLSGRIINPGRVHKAFAVTGAIALGTAASIPGTVVSELLPPRRGGQLTIGHPSGRIPVEITLSAEGGGPRILGASLMRTARRLMDGHVYVREGLLGASSGVHHPQVDRARVAAG